MYDLEILVKQTEDAKDLAVPDYASAHASGFDLYANVTEDIVLGVGKRMKIKTGICVEIPNGYEIEIRPRSGNADRYGVTVLNSPGTIDSDYRGELEVLLINLGEEPFVIKRGARIAQAVVSKIEKAKLTVKDALSDTCRGAGGFGSTGM